MSFKDGIRQQNEERAEELRRIQSIGQMVSSPMGKWIRGWVKDQIKMFETQFYSTDLAQLPTDRVAVMAAQHRGAVSVLTQLLDQLEQAPSKAAETAPELAAIEEALNG